jgi:hypothetical protein
MNRSNMRAIDTIIARKPPAAGLAGDVPRAFLACGFLLAVCVSAAVIAHGSRASTSPASRTRATTEGNQSTGSIQLVSPIGNLCRERIIDNSTWQIRNNGWVDCEEALAKAANSAAAIRSPGSRLDMIRESFRSRP